MSPVMSPFHLYPGRLLAHLDAKNISLSDGCQAVVLDEVDVLLGVRFYITKGQGISQSLPVHQVWAGS